MVHSNNNYDHRITYNNTGSSINTVSISYKVVSKTIIYGWENVTSCYKNMGNAL